MQSNISPMLKKKALLKSCPHGTRAYYSLNM